MNRAAAELASAALLFLEVLTSAQRGKTVFPFAASERMNWHYVPRSRSGLAFKEMTPVQRQRARALLAAGLSQAGMLKAEAIMSLEAVLRDLEDGSIVRDPEKYYVTIFGEPGPAAPWGWRVEGHHVSVNITVVGDDAIAGAPLFFGTNPAEVRSGPKKGLRVLAGEEDLGRALVTSLDGELRKIAIISTQAPSEILTGADRRISRERPAGVAAERLPAGARKSLRRLIEEYCRRLRPEIADADLAEIERAGMEQVHFAWAGGLQKGDGHYYRVQGPTFLIEYDNTQNDANHVHAVWRKYDGDFGEDLLKAHYDRGDHRHDHR